MDKDKKQTIGFWDLGEETKLDNCGFEGFDVGVKSEGKKMVATNCDLKTTKKVKNKWYQLWWVKYFIFPLLSLLIASYIIYSLGWN